MSEIMIAQKTPVCEAEYALEERSPLDFYNCLIPKLKEHRRFKVDSETKFSIVDFKAQLEAR